MRRFRSAGWRGQRKRAAGLASYNPVMGKNHVALQMLKMLRATYPDRWRAKSEREIVRVCAEAVPNTYAKIDGQWRRLYVHHVDDLGTVLYAKESER